jgi:mannose-6-phosphate isomerase-like protein (cupin superfamily)
MELGADTVEVEPGMVIYIEPGTPHRLRGDVRTVVFGVPALEQDDEFFDC